MIIARYKLNFTNQKSRGRPLNRWSDDIGENSGVPLLILERRATDLDTYQHQVYMCSARGRRVLRK